MSKQRPPLEVRLKEAHTDLNRKLDEEGKVLAEIFNATATFLKEGESPDDVPKKETPPELLKKLEKVHGNTKYSMDRLDDAIGEGLAQKFNATAKFIPAKEQYETSQGDPRGPEATPSPPRTQSKRLGK